jgi:hypothetical protein
MANSTSSRSNVKSGDVLIRDPRCVRIDPVIEMPHDTFLNHDAARMRRMVENLSRYGQGRL